MAQIRKNDGVDWRAKKELARSVLLVFIFFIFCPNSYACFFKSDCPDGYQCVAEKKSVRGSCQPDQNAPQEKKTPKVDIKCAWNMDCPVNSRCVKSPGAAQGICWENQSSSQPNLTSEYKECTFNSDCGVGSACQRPRGSVHGFCQETVFKNIDNTNNNKFFTKDKIEDKILSKQCLMDVDCGLSYTCVQSGKSVYGSCQAKAQGASR